MRRPSWIRRTASCLSLPLLVIAMPLRAQSRGAAALRERVDGITTTGRVLLIGVHPDDDDPLLIAALARGHHVQTAYLSLTRGEAGDNFIGNGGTISLGAIRTKELLAARRVDGGISYFTRAIDFGVARNADEALEHWPHDSLLGDIVTVIRSFRPQVIVAGYPEHRSDENGQHQLIGPIVREAFDAAADSTRYPVARYGALWTPAKLYRPGRGLTIDVSGYDLVLGQTYNELARDSRSEHRSEGFLNFREPPYPQTNVSLQRVAAHVADSTLLAHETTIFDGADTSFARFARDASPAIAASLRSLAAAADSVRAALDLSRPARVVQQLAHVASEAASIRHTTAWCGHPSLDAATPAGPARACTQASADLDASIDLVLRRANEALLDAAGVVVDATAFRDLLAWTNLSPVTIAVSNHGETPITLTDVDVAGAVHREMTAATIAPDSSLRVTRVVANLPEPRLWWVDNHTGDLFPNSPSSVDGLAHPADAPPLVTLPGVAIPEELRRTSDATVSLTVAGANVTLSLGPVVHRAASPAFGLQERPVAGVPSVTMAFEHGLEWIPTNKPLDRKLRVALRSHSTEPRAFSLRVVSPAGVKVDSLPTTITLEPFEQKDIFLHLRGKLEPGRYEFGVKGVGPGGEIYIDGFQPLEYSHIDPVYVFHSSAIYLQAVNVNVPPALVVAYIEGVGDASSVALRQIGLPFVYDVSADDVGNLDLSRFAAVVVGPRAYEAHPSLLAQNSRLLDFARNGGTLVVLNGQYVTTSSGALAYPAVLSRPAPEFVTQPGAPVTVLDPRARVLNWPNKIGPKDWQEWVRERALFVPTEADAHYAHVVEMHDPGQRENRNAILVAPLGKGTYVYSTLTFYQQIPGGVPGALRLFVNLLSAGCRPGGAPAVGKC